MKQQTQKLNEIRTPIVEFYQKGGKHINLVYAPETATLTIGGTSKNGGFSIIKEVSCTPEIVAIFLTGVINDTTFITSNTQRPNNIFVEYGAFR